MVLLVIIVCFIDSQEIVLPLRVKIYPEVDLISNESDMVPLKY